MISIKPEYLLEKEIIEKYPDLINCIAGRLFIRKENKYIDREKDLETELSDMVKDYNIGNNASMVTRIMKRLKMSKYKKEEELFQKYDWIVPFENGYFNIKNEIFTHPDDKAFFYNIPHNFEGLEHDCPIFKQALKDWLLGQQEVNIVKPWDIFEIIGYCMTPNTDLRKAFYIFGPTLSGKTTFENLFYYIIGKENIAHISLQDMDGDFGMDGLQLKIVDMIGDHSSKKIKDSSNFKSITGADNEIRVNAKYIAQTSFRNYLKLVFAGNQLPTFEDEEAIWNRWILINFANKFEISPERWEIKFMRECSEEIKGILAESILGLIRLYKRGGFRSEITQNIKHVWDYNSNSLYRFVVDKCVITEDPNDLINQVEFRREYVKYCFKYKLGESLSKKLLTRNMENLFCIFSTRKKIQGNNGVHYEGIRFKTMEEIKTEKEFNEHATMDYLKMKEDEIKRGDLNDEKNK